MMGSLFKWEMKQTLSSKSFWIIGASLVALPALMLMLTIHFSIGMSGYTAYIEGLNNFNAFLIFLIGVFAGIHVTGAFEGRKIQSAVMAGNSRFSILMAKFTSFISAVAIYGLVSIAVCSVISFGMTSVNDIEGSIARAIIGRAAVYIVVEIAYAATCFLASMFIKHLGGAIGLNLGLLLTMNLAAQVLLSFDWAEKFVRLFPVGQTMFVLADMSNGNIVTALASSAVTLAAVAALSYARFSRRELK